MDEKREVEILHLRETREGPIRSLKFVNRSYVYEVAGYFTWTGLLYTNLKN
jgi:hypothetical protein